MEAKFKEWIALGRPDTFIEWWVKETGTDTGSPAWNDALQWCVREAQAFEKTLGEE